MKNHRLNRGELELLARLIDREYGQAEASRPRDSRYEARLYAIAAKLQLQLAALK